MRGTEDLSSEVAGTTVGDQLEVHAWRGGELVAEDLQVGAWGIRWSGDQQVQGQATLTVADPDGALAPWALSDPLGPGGSRLQITWVFGASGRRVPLGWWRIREALPSESWRVYDLGDQRVQVAGGGSVVLRADEETATIAMERLDAEVVTASTCLVEVARLLRDICPVVVDTAVVDAPVPAGLVYGDSRMDAVEDLLAVVDAVHRMGPDGSLEVVPTAGVGPVWTVTGGDGGALVALTRSLSDAGIYNGAVSTGETSARLPLVGRAYLEDDPLEWGGPFGRVPIFHNAVAQTQAGVEADARTVLASRRTSGEVDLSVTCLTHPGLQINDRVTVIPATPAGEQALTGRVVGMQIQAATSAAGTTPAKLMALTVAVAAGDLEAIGGRVARARS